MKKFWTVVLKIVMFMSLAGIIVFSCIAIISSNNIAFEAYNYLNTNKDTLALKEFTQRADNDIKSSYGASGDVYVNFLSMAILDTQSTFDYYIDYLALDDTLSKGDQNVLINDFKSCTSAKQKCEQSYSNYLIAYKNASDGVSIAVEYVKSCERDFVYNYANLYNCLATLQYDLYKTAKINVVKVESYDFQKYMIRTGLSSGVVEKLYIETNIEKSPEKRVSLSSDEKYNVYNSYKTKMSTYSDKNTATDGDLQQYVSNLNALDTFSWAKNYESYLSSLNNVLREKATKSKTFFDENFR